MLYPLSIFWLLAVPFAAAVIGLGFWAVSTHGDDGKRSAVVAWLRERNVGSRAFWTGFFCSGVLFGSGWLWWLSFVFLVGLLVVWPVIGWYQRNHGQRDEPGRYPR